MRHCEFCSDPYRATLIALSRKGLRTSVICRRYGLRVTTVTMMLAEARRRECLPHPTCRHCPVRISSQRVVCRKQACRAALDRDNLRLRRARFGHRRSPLVRQPSGHKEPPNFVWPELPHNPRERTERVPKPVPGAPILYVASLLGVGNKRAEIREAALAKYAAALKANAPPLVPPPPAKPRAITPFRPLAATPAPESFWAATRHLPASGRLRPSNTYVVAPPRCPTLGTLVLQPRRAA